jgi:hypothetical protein
VITFRRQRAKQYRGPLRCEQPLQPVLHDLVARALGGGREPNLHLGHAHRRKVAEALGVSKSTVQRVWAQARLKPHRLDRYMVSNDPWFEQKAADIIGLYMKARA